MVFVRPFALFDMIFVFSGLISMPYAVDAVSTFLTRFYSSSSLPASPSISSAKRKFVIILPLILTVPSWLSSASVMVFSRKMLNSVGDNKQVGVGGSGER